MTWTKTTKPTGTPYTRVNPQGKEEYDSELTYDSSVTYYDGINEGAWTGITKNPTQWFQATMTWAEATFPWGGWSKIDKPI